MLLEIFSFSITANNQNKEKTFFLNSSNFITTIVYSNYYKITEYFGLRRENNQLLEENILLKNNARSIDTIEIKNIIDTAKNEQFQYISGNVVKNSILSKNNYITVNRGKKDGIIKDMGVVDSKGVVGIVTNVSNNFCIVLSVLNNLNSIGCKLKNSEYFGSAFWDSKSYKHLTLTGIPNHVSIKKGDTVTTSGYGFIFPPNIIVGTVDTMWKNSQNNFYTISLNLSTDLKKTSSVYLIKNMRQDEQKQLELETIEMLE